MSLLYPNPHNPAEINTIQRMIDEWDWDGDSEKKTCYLKGIRFGAIPLESPLRYFITHELRKRFPLDFSVDQNYQNILYNEMIRERGKRSE